MNKLVTIAVQLRISAPTESEQVARKSADFLTRLNTVLEGLVTTSNDAEWLMKRKHLLEIIQENRNG